MRPAEKPTAWRTERTRPSRPSPTMSPRARCARRASARRNSFRQWPARRSAERCVARAVRGATEESASKNATEQAASVLADAASEGSAGLCYAGERSEPRASVATVPPGKYRSNRSERGAQRVAGVETAKGFRVWHSWVSYWSPSKSPDSTVSHQRWMRASVTRGRTPDRDTRPEAS